MKAPHALLGTGASMQPRRLTSRLAPLVFAAAAATSTNAAGSGPSAQVSGAEQAQVVGPSLMLPGLHAAARATSAAAWQSLLTTSPKAHALWRLGQAGPSVVTGLHESTQGDSPTARALSFVEKREALFGVSAAALRTVGTRTANRRVVVDLQQTLAGRDVYGHDLAVTLDDAGFVLAVSNGLTVLGDVAVAAVGIDAARATALAAIGAVGGSAGRRVFVANAHVAFEAALFLMAPPGTLAAVEVVVNLHDGTVSSMRSAVRQ